MNIRAFALALLAASPVRADQRDPRLPELFAQLKVATDVATAGGLEQQIWDIWTTTEGAEAATAFMAEWLKEIGYEKHLYDGEESEKVAAAKWTNVLEFCDWMAQRCGGQIEDAAGVTARSDAPGTSAPRRSA